MARGSTGKSGSAPRRGGNGGRKTSAGRPRKLSIDSAAGGARRKKAGGRGKPKPRNARSGVWLRRGLIWGGTLMIWCLILVVGVTAYYAYDLPQVGSIERMTRRPNVTLLTVDGTTLASFGDRFGATVELADLPPHLPHAVLAVEDRRFYEHGGVDFRGLARAMLANLVARRIVQGGSTITQQLAKNLFLTPERTVKRKVQEIMLALWLERRFTKDQILTIYLNRVYFGAGAYGIDAAARHYFGKPAREASVFEAALLAGLLKAPSRLNPMRAADAAERRGRLVINAMVEAEFLSPAEAELAKRTPPARPTAAARRARHFTDWIMAQVRDYLGGIDRDLRIKTTLDPTIQAVAEQEVGILLEASGPQRDASQAAVVSLDPGGAVRAMVGGRDYVTSQFNRATQALRQPGSAFKTFVFLAGMRQGMQPDNRMADAPINVRGWRPGNYNDRYYGEVTLREAYARSLNSVAVRIALEVGPERVVELAHALGITTPLANDGSIALGTSEVTLLDLTGAHAVFANGGKEVLPYGIEEIADADGTILYRRSSEPPRQLLGRRELAAMTDLMNATVVWGTGKRAQLDRPAGGKTGTSQSFRDAWFVGLTSELVTGVWFGNDDASPMKKVTGGTLPATLWQRIMAQALEGRPPRPLPGGEALVAEVAPAPAPAAQEAADSDDGFIERILRSLGAGPGDPEGAEQRLERYRRDP